GTGRAGSPPGARARRAERGRAAGDDRPGARVGEPHAQPGERRRVGFPEQERQETRGRAAPAPDAGPAPESAPRQPLRDAPTERILAGDEDVITPQRIRRLVTRGRGAGENDVRRYDAKSYDVAS